MSTEVETLNRIWKALEERNEGELLRIFRYFDYTPELCFPELSYSLYEWKFKSRVLSMVGIKKKKVRYASITSTPRTYEISFWLDRYSEILVQYNKRPKDLPKLCRIALRDFLGQSLYSLERPSDNSNVIVWFSEKDYKEPKYIAYES